MDKEGKCGNLPIFLFMKKTVLILAGALCLIASCQSENKEKPNKKEASKSQELKAESKETVYTSDENSPTEYMKLVPGDNGERQWFYWTDKKPDTVELEVKIVDGLEAVYFKGASNKLYEIVQVSDGFSLFLGEKRLQWYQQTDPTPTETKDSKKVYTARGIGDGYFEQVYVTTEDGTIKSMDELPAFNMLHIIPSYLEPDGIARFMNTIVEDNFGLYGIFEEFTGEVILFYDKEKRHKAATFQTKNGNVEGTAIVYTPKGRVLVERKYNKGKWIKNVKSPACADWHYNQDRSNLSINDLKNGQSVQNGVKIISLIPSLQRGANYDDILDKSSYSRPFTVNDKKYTGKLIAYNWTTNREEFQRFELNFKGGMLHGDIKVFSEFFGMTLHEIFDEGDLTETVFVINTDDMDGVAKPIIYFYPEGTTELIVTLDFEGELTHTYPKYKNEWKVTAHPDGTLFDEAGQEYYALYWEGDNSEPFTLNEGSIVTGKETTTFLEESLETLGLNRREANEFIMYWLPKMEDNAYNLIHFSTDEYEEMAALDIQPQPETLIRVMMVFQPLKSPVSIPKQDIEALRKERKGFTVVEWGGKEVNRPNL